MTGHAVADVVERLGVGLREVGQRHARLGPDDLGLVGVLAGDSHGGGDALV